MPWVSLDLTDRCIATLPSPTPNKTPNRRHLEHRAHLARDNGDTTPYGDSPLATSSFRVYHARRMSNAIIVADSRAVERYLGLQPTRQVGAPDALHPIDERAGY